MNVLMIIRIAFRALARNKSRAALTMLGIIIGVSAVIVMVSIGQGASATVQSQIESMGTNLLFVSAGGANAGSGVGARRPRAPPPPRRQTGPRAPPRRRGGGGRAAGGAPPPPRRRRAGSC